MVHRMFRPEWRTQNRRRRRFFALYMGWLERVGYIVSAGLLALFGYSFYWPTDEYVTVEEAFIEAKPMADASLVAPAELLIEAKLVDDGQEVVAGQPLLRYYQGEEARLRRAYLEAKEILEARGLDAKRELELLQANSGQGAPRIYVAKASGVVRLDAPERTWFNATEKVLEILDYSKLQIASTLAGKSISRAKVGQEAEVSSIKFGAEGGVAVFGESSNGSFVSRSLLSPQFVQSVKSSLNDTVVQARDDVPLVLKEVEDIEVETRFTGGVGQTISEPLPGFTLKGKVEEGRHVLVGQLALLPEAVRKQIESALSQEFERNKVSVVGSPRLLVKFRAEDGTTAEEAVNVASLKRTFDATIRIVDPPAEFIDRVKRANRMGKKVSCRVRVKTGTRSLANMLLRRS